MSVAFSECLDLSENYSPGFAAISTSEEHDFEVCWSIHPSVFMFVKFIILQIPSIDGYKGSKKN